MYSCTIGNYQITKDGKRISSIVDININNDIILSVFPGSLSPNDILIKYKDIKNKSRLRTPQHIHWVVDILIKKERSPELTNALLEFFENTWNSATGLEERNYETITDVLKDSTLLNNSSEFDRLNDYGFYSVEFLIILMELLTIMEKTNNANAFMFGKVINSLLNSSDLFSIISTANHKGR